jgi:orotidine-5'-phosphate decarboxylase
VHASGGSAVLRAAVEAARPFPELKVLALTVITSMCDSDLREVGVDSTGKEQVVRLGKLASEAGCHGVVASPQEARVLREVLPSGCLIVTPGTQMPGASRSDQARTTTPRAAVSGGSTHLVIGRAIAKSADPAEAFSAIRRDIEQADASQ